MSSISSEIKGIPYFHFKQSQAMLKARLETLLMVAFGQPAQEAALFLTPHSWWYQLTLISRPSKSEKS